MYLKLLWRSVARSVLKQSEFCWALLKCQLLHNAFPHSPLLSSSQLQCWSLCKDQKKNVIVRTQNFCYRVDNKVRSRVLVLISKLSSTPCMYVILEFFCPKLVSYNIQFFLEVTPIFSFCLLSSGIPSATTFMAKSGTAGTILPYCPFHIEIGPDHY